MFGKTRSQLQAEIDQLKEAWAQDQTISKQLLDHRTEECKALSVRCAVLEASLADAKALLGAIATAIAHEDPDYVTAAPSTDKPRIIKDADPELEALLAEEEELRKDATITVFELARELGLTNAEVVKTCQDCGIAVKSHTSKLTKSEADVVRFQYMEV